MPKTKIPFTKQLKSVLRANYALKMYCTHAKCKQETCLEDRVSRFCLVRLRKENLKMYRNALRMRNFN